MRTVSVLLTLISAGLYALSFPPLSLYPLAWVALAPFFVAITLVCSRTAVLYGALWGVTAAYGVGWWFPGMVSNYLQVSPFFGWVGFFAVSLLLAGSYFAVFALWLSWLAGQHASSPLLIAAGWGVCEFARARMFVGNPWALSAYSQVACTRLMQIADTTGPYGVGVLIAAVNVCLAGLFAPALRGRRPMASLVCVGALLGVTLLYGECRLAQMFTTGEPVSIAVVQAAIDQQARWKPEHHAANLARYLTLSQNAALSHPALIFWPEYAVDFHLQRESSMQAAVFHLTQDLGADLILGGQYYEYGTSELLFRNSVFLVRRGRLAGRYDKVRLLPLAENNQFKRFFPQFRDRYEPGQQIQLLRTTVGKVGAFVCFEAMYPDLVRRFAVQGAEILANPSNDGWFGHAAAARHGLDIATVRAIENRRYLVRATSTGISAIVDPYGRLMTSSSFGSPAVLMAPIFLSRAQTPYQQWGDFFIWVALGFSLAVSLSRLLRLGFKQLGERGGKHESSISAGNGLRCRRSVPCDRKSSAGGWSWRPACVCRRTRRRL